MPKQPADQIQPAYLRIERTMERSGLNRSRIYALLGEGKLTARKDGRATLIKWESVLNYLDSLPPAQIGAGRVAA